MGQVRHSSPHHELLHHVEARDLRTVAQRDGVHGLLDFPGVIMTDSGTFQSYVYGDVEVGVDEIVAFSVPSAWTSPPCSTCFRAPT